MHRFIINFRPLVGVNHVGSAELSNPLLYCRRCYCSSSHVFQRNRHNVFRYKSDITNIYLDSERFANVTGPRMSAAITLNGAWFSIGCSSARRGFPAVERAALHVYLRSTVKQAI